jgi:hypothetical protein
MKLRHIILGLSLLFFAGNLFGQTNQVKKIFVPFLDEESQSNVVITVSDFGSEQPSPLEYTNLISNTNLFTPKEQKLLEEVFIKYKNYQDLTTNSGPPGTVLVGLYKTNFIIPIIHKTNEQWVARFQYTNSEAQEEVRLGNGIAMRYFTKTGDGYIVGIGNSGGDLGLRLFQIKQRGVLDGLQVDFVNNRLQLYMHYTNGKAIGKYFMWNPRNGNLILEAEFKEPYDLEKHRLQTQWR